MHSSSFKLALPAAAVAAILAVAPIQLGSPHAFGFAQALAASPVGMGGHALAKGSAGVAGTAGVAGVSSSSTTTTTTTTTTTLAHPYNKGAGNPYGASFGIYSSLR
jgi:hypothetical protein